ncbi:MAG: chemotaxis protein CheW [Bacteroidota bacterium]
MYENKIKEMYDPEQWNQIHQLLATVRTNLESQTFDTERSDAAILRKRSRFFARVNERTELDAIEQEDLVLFMLGGDTYGVSCNDIEEVIPLQNLVALPNTNKAILGISSLRGILFAVVDLKRVLNIPASDLTTMHRVLMVRHESFKVGFLVDSVHGMRSYGKNDIQELPPEIHERSRTYLQGLAFGNVMIINARVVIQDPLVTGADKIVVTE